MPGSPARSQKELMFGSQKFSQNLNWKILSNLLRISDVCLQMLSDSKN